MTTIIIEADVKENASKRRLLKKPPLCSFHDKTVQYRNTDHKAQQRQGQWGQS